MDLILRKGGDIMCCEPGGHGHQHGSGGCCCGCCGTTSTFGRMFLSKEERKERLENYLKELEKEIKEVEKRIKELE